MSHQTQFIILCVLTVAYVVAVLGVTVLLVRIIRRYSR